MNFSLIFLVQNLYYESKVMRTLSLNTSYFILFKNYRDQLQMETLGRHMLPGQLSYFRTSFQSATSEQYGYLVADVSPVRPTANVEGVKIDLPPLRSKILPGEDTVFYFPR